MEIDQLSRRTRHARASLLIVSTATILSLVHNIKFDEAEILGLTLNVTQEILFQSYTILILYFLYFFLFYCFSDYTNSAEDFFSYQKDSKKRYYDFFNDTFSHFIKAFIVRTLSESLEKQPSEEGPNSNTNILIGLEIQVDKHVSTCVEKYNGEQIWHNRSAAFSFIDDLWMNMSSNMEIAKNMDKSDLDQIKNLMISMARNKKIDLTETSYPAISKFHLRVPEIALPAIFGFLALWINLGLPFSSTMINTLRSITSLLHSSA